MRRGSAEGAGVCGLAGKVVILNTRAGVWRGEKVMLSQKLDGRVVVVVVDAKVDDEPMLRRPCVG